MNGLDDSKPGNRTSGDHPEFKYVAVTRPERGVMGSESKDYPGTSKSLFRFLSQMIPNPKMQKLYNTMRRIDTQRTLAPLLQVPAHYDPVMLLNGSISFRPKHRPVFIGTRARSGDMKTGLSCSKPADGSMFGATQDEDRERDPWIKAWVAFIRATGSHPSLPEC